MRVWYGLAAPAGPMRTLARPTARSGRLIANSSTINSVLVVAVHPVVSGAESVVESALLCSIDIW
jgi:hypothetical protein